MENLENALTEKDLNTDVLIERIEKLEETEKANEDVNVAKEKESETSTPEQSVKPKCNDCECDSNRESDLTNQSEKIHVESLNCEYCDFTAKNIGGLRIHVRRMHSFRKKLFECGFCTFTSKTESEMKTHNSKYNITHSKLDYNEHIEELNYEIFAMKETGLLLLGMQHYDEERWRLWMERNFKTLGKNPR